MEVLSYLLAWAILLVMLAATGWHFVVEPWLIERNEQFHADCPEDAPCHRR